MCAEGPSRPICSRIFGNLTTKENAKSQKPIRWMAGVSSFIIDYWLLLLFYERERSWTMTGRLRKWIGFNPTNLFNPLEMALVSTRWWSFSVEKNKLNRPPNTGTSWSICLVSLDDINVILILSKGVDSIKLESFGNGIQNSKNFVSFVSSRENSILSLFCLFCLLIRGDFFGLTRDQVEDFQVLDGWFFLKS